MQSSSIGCVHVSGDWQLQRNAEFSAPTTLTIAVAVQWDSVIFKESQKGYVSTTTPDVMAC